MIIDVKLIFMNRSYGTWTRYYSS